MIATPKTGTGFNASDFLSDFAFDPTNNQWFGIIDQRAPTPTEQWLLVSLTNLPEPATLTTIAAALPLLLRRRERS